MENQDGVDFLLVEHGKSLDLIQHYDNLRVSLMKFAFSYHSVVAAVILAVYRYQILEEKSLITQRFPVFFLFLTFLVLAFLVGVAIVLMLTQNRKYFVLVARQANTIRGFLFSQGSLASKIESVLPINPEEPKALNFRSTHLITIFLLVIINSIWLSLVALFFVMMLQLSVMFCWFIPIICGVISFVLQFYSVKWVLKEAS